MDDIIQRKVKGDFVMEHPDCPDRIDARLYYCWAEFSDTTRRDEDNRISLQGTADGLDASQGHQIAMRMLSAKPANHAIHLAPPVKSFSVDALVPPPPGGSGRVGKNGKAGNSGKNGNVVAKKASSKAPSVGKHLHSGFKLLQKILDEVARLGNIAEELLTHDERKAFGAMLQLHVDGLKKEYDSLRAHLTKNPPEEETHIYIYIMC